MGRNIATGESMASYEERGNDLYETPPEATEALLKVEPLEDIIWECAAGRGAISRVLRSHGHQVLSTDLFDYGSPDVEFTGMDFLSSQVDALPAGINTIVTNPPYMYANEFVAKAMILGIPKIIMLLRLAYLESMKRTPILDRGSFKKVYVFKNRLPRMHREGWTGKKATSRMAFAWFVWEKDYTGPATIERIQWTK